MKKLFFLLMGIGLLGAITSSCKKEYCENQNALFVLRNTTLPISFDSLVSIKQTLNYLETTYCYEGEKAQPVLFFDVKQGEIVKSDGRNVLSIGIEPTPCVSDLEYDFDQILEIVLDGNNILIEGKRMPLDSVGQYVYYQYLNYGKRKGFSRFPQGNGIWLISEMNRPVKDFNSIIDRVVKGYLETADLYCNTFFEKKVCELDAEELNALKHKLPFHLAIKYSDKVKPALEVGF